MDARSLRRLGSLALVFVLACLVVAGQALAQQQSTPHSAKVGIYVSPPFVLKDGNGYSGMALELWQKVAAELGIISEYQEFQSEADLLEAVASGTVQAAVGNISITKARAQIIDFTQPWFDAGLRVMVPSNAHANIAHIIADLREAGHLANFAWIALGVLLATALMTFLDRKFDPEFHQRWRDGLADNFYHVISLFIKGDAHRKNLFGWLGRIVQGLWLLCGVAVIAYVASSVTSVMTAAHIANRINSVADLHGKVVGVRPGSAAEDYMKGAKIKTRPFIHIADAADALMRREISAIVDDSPVLEYFAHTHPDLALDVVGSTFHPDKYGFAFPAGSSLTKPVSLGVIALQESDELAKLRQKYFGFKP